MSHFNSRAPCEARPKRRQRCTSLIFISTHASHARRDGEILSRVLVITISTHAPYARRDRISRADPRSAANFNSRAPCEARHGGRQVCKSGLSISTHAPHARRDLREIIVLLVLYNFNSRAPCEARPVSFASVELAWTFQLTRPMRGATERKQQGCRA